jgi:hypothetical protein
MRTPNFPTVNRPTRSRQPGNGRPRLSSRRSSRIRRHKASRRATRVPFPAASRLLPGHRRSPSPATRLRFVGLLVKRIIRFHENEPSLASPLPAARLTNPVFGKETVKFWSTSMKTDPSPNV